MCSMTHKSSKLWPHELEYSQNLIHWHQITCNILVRLLNEGILSLRGDIIHWFDKMLSPSPFGQFAYRFERISGSHRNHACQEMHPIPFIKFFKTIAKSCLKFTLGTFRWQCSIIPQITKTLGLPSTRYRSDTFGVESMYNPRGPGGLCYLGP